MISTTPVAVGIGPIAPVNPVDVPIAATPYDFGQMVQEWSGLPYAELSVLLVHLRFLRELHQTHHWIARGDSFYGDHLLLQRVYEAIDDNIDKVAEKINGLASEKNVDIYMQLKQLSKLAVAKTVPKAVPCRQDLFECSLECERDFLAVIECVKDRLDASGQLTYGLDNMLADIADEHEHHVYLFRQACER